MLHKMKHLEIIQGVITRMAGNSFALKGWSVTLVTGFFALAGKTPDKIYFLIVYIPIIIFWGLDAYYLMQERLYRTLYSKVTETSEDEIDFNMNVKLDEFKNEGNSWLKCVFSYIEVCFYAPLAIISAIVVRVAFN